MQPKPDLVQLVCCAQVKEVRAQAAHMYSQILLDLEAKVTLPQALALVSHIKRLKTLQKASREEMMQRLLEAAPEESKESDTTESSRRMEFDVRLLLLLHVLLSLREKGFMPGRCSTGSQHRVAGASGVPAG